jgi:hypothetical protein
MEDSEKENKLLREIGLKKAKKIQFVNDKLKVPNVDQIEWCKTVLLPQEFAQQQQHMIGFKPVIEPKESEQNVSFRVTKQFHLILIFLFYFSSNQRFIT